jgi:seryl-tRNA synthetase
MLQVGFIRDNKEMVIRQLEKRSFKAEVLITTLLNADNERKKTQQDLDLQLAELNQLSKEIGQLFKTGNKVKAEELKTRTTSLKDSSHLLKEKYQGLEKQLRDILYQIPNVPHLEVPAGLDASSNEITLNKGEIPAFSKTPLPHWEIASKYQLIDFDLGSKITGAGFPVYTGKGAKLQRSLINFFLDEALKMGFEEVIPPHLVNEASATGTGQLPDKEGQMYHTEMDHLYLIPTAEVPITNIFRDVIVNESDFPIKKVGYTPCFRREAGSYGKDVRGLNRLHQFDKVEIVQIAHPDHSYEVLQEMVRHVQHLLEQLNLPYRIAKLCAGDLGFTSALTYDMEVYSAAQEKWLEVSSISNFETYQSNRLKIRYKDKDGKSQLAHTLNGSALALPRILAALLENNQTEEGIRIPEALVPYTGFHLID